MNVYDAIWAIVITGIVVLAGMSVLALMLLGAAMAITEWLMRSIERLEPMPPLEDDEHESLEEQGRGMLRGLIAGIENAGVRIRKGKHR